MKLLVLMFSANRSCRPHTKLKLNYIWTSAIKGSECHHCSQTHSFQNKQSKERRVQVDVYVCLQALRDWVAIESDSSNVLKRPELHRMMEMVAQKLRQMGGTVELVDIGEQEVSDEAHLWWNAPNKTYEEFIFLLTAKSSELLKRVRHFKQRTETNKNHHFFSQDLKVHLLCVCWLCISIFCNRHVFNPSSTTYYSC